MGSLSPSAIIAGQPWLELREIRAWGGAGPQRIRTYVYAWNGTSLQLAMKYSERSPILYFNILDANEAFAEGKYWLAAGRYHQAIVYDSLLDLDPYPASPGEQAEGRGRDELLNPADLLIFTPVGERYQLAFSARDSGIGQADYDKLVNVTVLEALDVNGDGRAEVLFQSFEPGADNPGTSGVFVIGWDGKTYRLVTPEGLFLHNPVGIRFVNPRGMGSLSPSAIIAGQPWLELREIRAWGGAGPQRIRTYVYAWNGTSLQLAMKYSERSPILYFNILDANEAFAEGKYWLAAGRYHQAIVYDSLLDLDPYPASPGEQAEGRGRDELLAFAQFRLALSQLKLGEEEAALEAIVEAAKNYTETWHGKAAGRFLDAFKDTGDEQSACQAMTAFAESNLESFQRLWDYGSGNPYFKPEALCLEPGLTPPYSSLRS